ncbi:MAG: glutamine amidotransferase, partial [Firmicutes bacterium]|nr:glutamine amidotransferase [Bacillota bacterium]
YGDRGNILSLQQRAQARGIAVQVIAAEVGQPVLWDQVDLVFMGGGEDSHQAFIYQDFMEKKKELAPRLEKGLPMLGVCGGYQLLGHYYRTASGQEIAGIGFLDVVTKAGSRRAIGDVLCASNTLGLVPQTLVGFENHGGQTFLQNAAQPLAIIAYGQGNNGQDRTEGCVRQHTIGTYLHGSLLPKNPHVADLLIQWALQWQGHASNLQEIDSAWEWDAHRVIVKRFSAS